MTDRNFSTGIDIDRKSLKRIPYARIAVHCPCGREHTWGPRDASLAQSVLLSEQVAPPRPSTSAATRGARDLEEAEGFR
jgi:hypothetical protein